MAGHSHWAGIKHKKGKADKQRSKIFSKLSKEITVAAKLGDKDPAMNPRLRSAIQAARSANMPKENIERAIDKSSVSTESNFENLRYEGFGPEKVAVIIEALTDNKNRTASSIRTIFQKSGGNLGTQASSFAGEDGGPPSTGQFFIAINPEKFNSNYSNSMKTLIKSIIEQEGARLPGSKRQAAFQKNKDQDIEINDQLLERINQI